MTTFSTSLKLELPGDGQQTGVWGQTTNRNLGTLLEQAITGVQSITMIDANYTLTNLNGTADEARNAVIIVNGTNTATRDVIAPNVNKLYAIYNNTTGGQAVRIIGSSGTGVTVPNGVIAQVFCDGTNFYSMLNGTVGAFTVASLLTAPAINDTGTLTVAGVTTLNGAATFASTTVHTGTATFNGASNHVGTTTVPTTATGDNSTNAASTALVTNKIAAITSVPSAVQIGTTNYTVLESGGYLYFRYGGVNKMRLDSSGNLVCTGNITAYGSI
jgi:hypothetical protein